MRDGRLGTKCRRRFCRIISGGGGEKEEGEWGIWRERGGELWVSCFLFRHPPPRLSARSPWEECE